MCARLLVADDSLITARLTEAILRRAGHETLLARDGVEALTTVYDKWPDLIVLDITMPLMNGYQVCRLLKSDERTRDIPIVMLTAREQAGDRYWGQVTGADAYVTKSQDHRDLVGTIERLLPARPTRPTNESAPTTSTPMESVIAALSRVNDLLDRKLYETTVLNEINRLASQCNGLRETVVAVAERLRRVTQFSALGILLAGQEAEDLFIVGTLEDEQARHVAQVTRDAYTQRAQEADGQPLQGMLQVHNYSRPGTARISRNIPIDLMKGGRLQGIWVYFGAGELPTAHEDQAALTMLTQQAALVVDNARLNAQIHHMAITDGLTGASNHRHLQQQLEHEFERARRYAHPLSFLMLDIDHFKTINDRYGHPAGDIALRSLVQMLREQLRAHDLLGRYGGEEFGIALPETPLEAAMSVGERLRRTAEAMVVPTDRQPLRFTISVGITGIPSLTADSYADLIRQADDALYRAKQGGRNRVCIAQGSIT